MELVVHQASVFSERMTFKEDSSLLELLVKEESSIFKPNRLCYRLSTIILAVVEIFFYRGLYDFRNPMVLVCDSDLEKIFDVSSFHRSQLTQRIKKHLKEKSGSESPVSYVKFFDEMQQVMRFYSQMDQAKTVVVQHQTFDIEGSYLVNPRFLKVLRSVKKLNKNQNVLSYRDICSATSEYILSNKHELFDLRNIQIAKVKGNLLGAAFRVDYFCRSQVTSFIRGQLKAVRQSKRLRSKRLNNLF